MSFCEQRRQLQRDLCTETLQSSLGEDTVNRAGSCRAKLRMTQETQYETVRMRGKRQRWRGCARWARQAPSILCKPQVHLSTDLTYTGILLSAHPHAVASNGTAREYCPTPPDSAVRRD